MLNQSFTQYAIVQTDSAQTFNEELNKKFHELRYKHPKIEQVSPETLFAMIKYTESMRIPETAADSFELETGCSFACSDCPCFEPILNRDGSENARVKYGNCKYSEYGRTYKSSRACDVLFKLIKSGEVRLCFAESDS